MLVKYRTISVCRSCSTFLKLNALVLMYDTYGLNRYGLFNFIFVLITVVSNCIDWFSDIYIF